MEVPFAWENKPGVCKARRDEDTAAAEDFVIKLRPPPCPVEKGRLSFDSQIPLPPCTFQGPPPSRSSSRKGGHHHRKEEDPFLAAYKECTKSIRKGHDGKTRLRRSSMFSLSCKNSCDVRDDGLVSKPRFSA